MIKKLWDYKKIRFLCVGSFNALVDLTTLNTLVFVGHLPVWLANTISVTIGITISYFLNHFIVFRHGNKPNPKLFLKFFVITGIGVIVLQTAVIYLTRPMYTDLLRSIHSISPSIRPKFSLNMAKITAILVGMFYNYLFYSKIVFKKKTLTETKETQEFTKLV
jgi:putative flippase GtrA